MYNKYTVPVVREVFMGLQEYLPDAGAGGHAVTQPTLRRAGPKCGTILFFENLFIMFMATHLGWLSFWSFIDSFGCNIV